eukprot:TRINITY_DN9309_c0_g1_i2.p1 TRINITY_DN9309_c0_g1~~TRINITY_DN9309_c0_g1_i2.p1  ORF type:complete len:1089 (+),score=218.61 TRINITY_DN9309_c0_g1_i2:44-3310(+)
MQISVTTTRSAPQAAPRASFGKRPASASSLPPPGVPTSSTSTSIASNGVSIQPLAIHAVASPSRVWHPPSSVASPGFQTTLANRPPSSSLSRKQLPPGAPPSTSWLSPNLLAEGSDADADVAIPSSTSLNSFRGSLQDLRKKGSDAQSYLVRSTSAPKHMGTVNDTHDTGSYVSRNQRPPSASVSEEYNFIANAPSYSPYDLLMEPPSDGNLFRGFPARKANRPPPSPSKNGHPIHYIKPSSRSGRGSKSPSQRQSNGSAASPTLKEKDTSGSHDGEYQYFAKDKKKVFYEGQHPKDMLNEVMKDDGTIYDEEFVENLETFSAPLRKAVIKELLRQLRHRNSLLNLVKSINAELDHETAMRRVINEACDFLKADRACLFRIDEKSQEIVSKVLSARNAQEELRFPIGRGIAGHVAQTGMFLNIPDAHENPLFNPSFDQKTGYRTRGILCMCIRDIQGKKCAVMQVINKLAGNGSFNEDDEKDMEVFAVQAGNSLRNGQLYDAALKAQHKISVLLEVAKQLSSELDLTVLCRTIMMKAKELLEADRCTLFLVDEKTKELWSKVADGSSEIRIPMTMGIAGHVASTGQTLNIPDAYLDPRFNPDVDRRSGYKTKSILCMPIRNARGAVIGVTQMINKLDGTFFDEADEQLLYAFSSQASVSLENSKLFQSTMDMRNFLESILKSITNLVLVLDMSGRMLTANRPTTPFLGVSEEVMMQSTFEDWIGSKNTVLFQHIKDSFSTTNPNSMVDYDYHLSSTAGSEQSIKTINYTVVALKDSEMRQTGVVIVMEDVSPQKKMQATLGRYMSPALADEILKQDNRLQLGGKHLKVATLFCDIRKFTSISEKMDASEVVDLLNEYFSHMVSAVFAEKGILDKYIGDALMAVFGVPMTADDDSYRSCRAALQMISNLADFNEKRRKQGLEEISIGIGINTGRVLSGNIGTERRLEYTVIGDGVNLASRVEGVTKQYGVSTIITEYTYFEVEGKFVVRELDSIRVVGKKQPIRIYELVREVTSANTLGRWEDAIDLFSKGLDLYRQRRFEEAIEMFTTAHRTRVGGDPPSSIFIERCKNLRENPPGEAWDGVWTMDSK